MEKSYNVLENPDPQQIDLFIKRASELATEILNTQLDDEDEIIPLVKNFSAVYAVAKPYRENFLHSSKAFTMLIDKLPEAESSIDLRQRVHRHFAEFIKENNIFEVRLQQFANNLYLSHNGTTTTEIENKVGKSISTALRINHRNIAPVTEQTTRFLEFIHKKDKVTAREIAEYRDEITDEFHHEEEKKKDFRKFDKKIIDLGSLLEHIEKGTTLNTEGRNERREKFKDPKNFEEFMFYYFKGLQLGADLKPLAKFHKDALDALFLGNKIYHIWEWFRGSAKSIMGTLYVPIWLTINKQMKGFIIVSDTADKAITLVSEFYAHLKMNKRLHADYGTPKIMGTPQGGVFLVQMSHDYFFKVWAFGMSQSVAGMRTGQNRPSLIVVDDADNPIAAYNSEQVKKKLALIRGTLYATLSRGEGKNHIIYSNNRIHPKGLTAELVKAFVHESNTNFSLKNMTHYSQIPISIDPVTGKGLTPDKGGVSSWPEFISTKKIMEDIAVMGQRDAMMQLYNEYIPEVNTFDISSIKYEDIDIQNTKWEDIVVYCDPAYSTSKDACYTACAAMALLKKKEDKYVIVVLDLFAEKTSNFTLPHLRMIEYISNATLQKTTGVIEGNGVQAVHFEPLYNSTIKEYPNLALYKPEIDTANKANKISRISMLIEPLQFGSLILDKRLKDKTANDILVNEMLNFPSGDLDILDAMEGGFKRLHRRIAEPVKAHTIKRTHAIENLFL